MEPKTTGLTINIRTRLILGFSAVCLLLAIAVGTTLWKVSAIDNVNRRVIELRVPTAFASNGMVNAINSSLASLRGCYPPVPNLAWRGSQRLRLKT